MKNYSRILVLLLMMLIIIGVRVFMPLSDNFKYFANFTGIGAVTLFGAAYFKNKVSSFLLPIGILLLSDIGLSLTMGLDYGFSNGMIYTYGAFILMSLVGRAMLKNVNLTSVLGASIVTVFIHWIITDFGVWYGSSFYTQNLAGFWTCLVAAIPYELNFLYGTIAYSALMFGAFETLKAKYPTLQLVKN